MEFKLKALAPIWTGGVERNDNSILHLTGIKGSIRWWYEVLIRGLDYYACDPVNDGCQFKITQDEKDKIKEGGIKVDALAKEKICPACYMFGCTGWSGKFILQLKEPGTNKPMQSLSSRGTPFTLHFLEQKKFDPEEEILLKMTLKLIIDYGALGGKTIFKPSEKEYKNTKFHHRDFGILARDISSNLPTEKIQTDEIVPYIEKFKKKEKNEAEWPNLKSFWFVKDKYIDRQQHNRLVKRNDDGSYKDTANEDDIFLGGFISREKSRFNQEIIKKYKDTDAASKKIFSFMGTENKNYAIKRCFGYIKSDDSLDDFIGKLDSSQLPFHEKDIIKGSELIRNL